MVHDTIADGIGQRRMPQIVMPEGRRELARDDGRPEVIAVLEDFEEILAFLVADRHEAPVVEHEDIGPGESDQQSRIGPGRPRERELMEQARGAKAQARKLLPVPVAPTMITA